MRCSPHIQIETIVRYSFWIPGVPLRNKHPGESRRIQHDDMKQKLTGLSQRYVTALRKHLKQGPRASLQPALGLGRRAVVLGLETLELARIHERALVTLEAASSKDGIAKRAEIFFTEAITPIVETHRAARQSKIQLEPAERDAGPAHGGTGRHQPPVAARHRPAQERGSRRSRKAGNTTPSC